jgi:hypothetical protein
MVEVEVKSEHRAHEAAGPEVGIRAAGDGSAAAINLESLTRVLNAHAEAIAIALGKVVSDKLSELKRELRAEASETQRAGAQIRELSENQKKIERKVERALERQRGQDWLSGQPAGDRDHLKKVEEKLRALEETLAGPRSLIESGDGEKRPPVRGEATWELPNYQPVPPDFRSK